MNYTFGHTSLAAERLHRIADFFNDHSFRFISSRVCSEIINACDMGCGPGYSTAMLAGATKAHQVTGIDISEEFIGQAKHHYPYYNFKLEDITDLQGRSMYDIIYTRFLLSHLTDIPHVIKTWMNLLSAQGRIFIDELEDIYTGVPVFEKYLQLSSALVRSSGADLFIGKKLDRIFAEFNIEINYSEIIEVQDQMAASWFYPNTTGVWETSETIKSLISEKELTAIQNELYEIMNDRSKESRITWKMKRIILT